MRVDKLNVSLNENQMLMQEEAQVLWEKCLKMIKDNIAIESFNTWFLPIKPLQLEGKALTLLLPSHFFHEVLEQNYVLLLNKILRHYLGPDAKLFYQVLVDGQDENSKLLLSSSPHENKSQNNPSLNITPQQAKGLNPFVIPGLQKMTIQSQLNPNYTFNNYIEGDCNRLARTAGIAVATKPGQTAFNPLFIYGGVALGKTHLVHAIGNEVKKIHPNKVVHYVPCEQFMSQFVTSLRSNQINDFIAFYQLIDVFIIDDIQFLAGKDKMQETFFTIFNHLHQNQKQIILTADMPPRDIKGIEDRLLSRFKWGLNADLYMPDTETRIAILKSKMEREGIELPDEIIEHIAYHINTNIRDLEGCLIGIIARSSFTKKEIDLTLVQNVIKDFIKSVSKDLTIDTICQVVAEYFKLKPENLKEKSRKREIVQARQLAMFFTKELTDASLKSIGMYFEGKDHSTVIHAIRTVKDLYDTSKQFRKYVEDLRNKFQIDM